MNNKDMLQRFLFEKAAVRGEIVRLNQGFQTIMQQHAYPAPLKQLLAEALVAANLLSATIKFEGRLTMQFQGKGDLKLLIAQTDHQFHYRGVAQWQGEPDYEGILNALKKGTLAIIIEPDDIKKQSYQGVVAWEGHSLAQSIEGYFKNSEQLPTRLWIAANETGAAGLLLQRLPASEEGAKEEWDHLVYLTETLTPEELLNCNTETLLHRLYHQEEVRLFEPIPVTFQCTCSVKRSENAILLLGQTEAKEELALHKKIVVKCEFCSKEYVFDSVDVEGIFRNSKDSQGGLQ